MVQVDQWMKNNMSESLNRLDSLSLIMCAFTWIMFSLLFFLLLFCLFYFLSLFPTSLCLTTLTRSNFIHWIFSSLPLSFPLICFASLSLFDVLTEVLHGRTNTAHDDKDTHTHMVEVVTDRWEKKNTERVYKRMKEERNRQNYLHPCIETYFERHGRWWSHCEIQWWWRSTVWW